MSKEIVLKKGLNLPVNGEAEKRISKSIAPGIVAVRPDDINGLLPRLLVKEGDRVLAGSPVLSDKTHPEILVSAPASGVVSSIVRGEKRKLLAVLIKADTAQQHFDFGAKNPASMDAAQVKAAILESGLWPWLIQRPYGTIANPEAAPKAIFVSAFNTAPLSPKASFAMEGRLAMIQKGIDALAKISPVHVSVNCTGSVFNRLENCSLHLFKADLHPAGNVGVQIGAISPIRKNETVWTISLAGLAAIGKLLATGKVDLRRRVAVTGPMAIEPSYVEALPGTPMKEFVPFYGTNASDVRIISGDMLSGSDEGVDGYLGLRDEQVTILKEGYEKELFGWIRPVRFRQFSADRSYFSWLMPWRKYDMDTNLHGGPRAFVMSDSYYAKVLPMDIYPLYLVKACLAGDIEKMEEHGIYEVLPEDLALCEFIDPSKNNICQAIADGISLMIKEMA